jgi:hypothetical protein
MTRCLLFVLFGAWLPAPAPPPAAPEWKEIKATIVSAEIKEITIRANGTATYYFFKSGTLKHRRPQTIALPKEDFEALKKVIVEADVTSIPTSVGRFVYSLTPCTIQIRSGKQEKRIQLLCPYEPLEVTKSQLEEEGRARRIWDAIWALEPLFDKPLP